MRHLSPVLGLGVVLLVSGCADSKWSLFRHAQDTARLPTDTVPTAAQLVTYLNNNASQIQSLTCLEMELDCKQGSLNQINLPAKLICQKPRNFRMRADPLGKTEADIGSNDQEFWYLIPKADPYLVHCAYQDLASGVRIPFPFQPEWVMETLGMSELELDANPPYEVRPNGRGIQLVRTTRNLQGQVVRKVTEFNPTTGRVAAHVIQNDQGKEICRAQITETQEIKRGVVLPRKIAFSYPAEGLELKMTLWRRTNDVVLNRQLDPEMARDLFTRPTLPGVPGFDLARGAEGINQVRPAGGLLQQR